MIREHLAIQKKQRQQKHTETEDVLGGRWYANAPRVVAAIGHDCRYIVAMLNPYYVLGRFKWHNVARYLADTLSGRAGSNQRSAGAGYNLSDVSSSCYIERHHSSEGGQTLAMQSLTGYPDY